MSAGNASRSSPLAVPVLRLALLCTEGGAETKRFRSTRLSGVLLAVSAVGTVLLVAHLGAQDAADVAALRLMAYAAWLYGLAGLPALQSPEARLASGYGLARLRGYPEATVSLRGLGLGLRLLSGLLGASLPGLIAAAAVSYDAQMLLWRCGLMGLCIIYLAVLAFSLGGVAAVCERVAPRSPRATTLAVVLGPFLLSFAVPGLPNLPSLFVWGFGQLVRFGGLAA